MSGFKEAVAEDIHKVFLNDGEFAERRTIQYDGRSFSAVPVIMTGLKEKDRRQLSADHAQGLYLVTSVLHCALPDLDGVQPEKGGRISISDLDGYMRDFYVASSVCEAGMLRVELEAIDE